MRTPLTGITQVSIGGKIRHRLTYQTPVGRKREHFTDPKAAKKRLKDIKADQVRFGLSANAITPALRAEAVAASKILEGTGLSLIEAARFMRDDWRRKQEGRPISEAISDFLTSRMGKAAKYYGTLEGRMKYVASAWAGRTTASITPADCQSLLDGIAGSHAPRTAHHYRTHLSVMFTFFEDRGWCHGNPAKKTAPIEVTGKEIEILSPADASALLANCDPSIVPGVVLGMFCGIRQSEIEKLDWSKVDLAEGHVTISAAQAKTNSRRVCPLPPNAKAWLAPYAQQSGKLWPEDQKKARELWMLARINAGFGPFEPLSTATRKAQLDPATGDPRKDLRIWHSNALRHSAISYKLAMKPDLAKLAYESGNSPSIIQKHYNGLATATDATRYFSIAPRESEERVVPFKAA